MAAAFISPLKEAERLKNRRASAPCLLSQPWADFRECSIFPTTPVARATGITLRMTRGTNHARFMITSP
jgi:hypothetical protein